MLLYRFFTTIGLVFGACVVLHAQDHSGVLIAKRSAGHETLSKVAGADAVLPRIHRFETGLSTFNPCTTAVPIAFGQTLQGALTSSDCQLEDLSYADFYTFTGTQGQLVTIDLASSAFDTYLGLANADGTWVIEDDDGGDGTNSRIVAVLPASGQYFIMANSVFPNTFGPYSLTLQGSVVCEYTLEPTSAQIPGAGGTFTFNVVTGPGCTWTTTYDPYSFIGFVTSGGTGPGSVSYTVQPNNDGVTRSTEIRVNGRPFTINQDFLVCTYSIEPLSAHHSPDATEAQFMMNTPAGCPWLASYSHFWIWTSTELKRGPGPVVYTLQPNNGADRSGSITVAGHTFGISQTGRNCTYSVSPLSVHATAPGIRNGSFTVDTQTGCTWNFGFHLNVDFPDGFGGSGPGTKRFKVAANHHFVPRFWNISFTGVSSFNIPFTQAGIPFRTLFDFFGDSKTDIGVYRPASGDWFILDSAGSLPVQSYRFGLQEDIIVPADFSGDRYTEVAVFRPSNGTWYFLDRVTGSFSAIPFGLAGDIPTPADFDGDGKADLAVYRPSSGLWFIRRSTDQAVEILRFGIAEDMPVAADYDGDGRSDVAVWRPSVGEWWIRQSSGGQVFAAQFGNSLDRAVPGDYTGDGKADIAIFRPANGNWYVLRSEDFSYYSFPFGLNGDAPVPADYDADGIVDPAVFRPGTSIWYMNRSAFGIQTLSFGAAGDIPIPSAFVR